MTINADKTTMKTADAREKRARIMDMARNMKPERLKLLIAALERMVRKRK